VIIKVAVDFFVSDVPGPVSTKLKRLAHEQRKASERYQLELLERTQKALGQDVKR